MDAIVITEVGIIRHHGIPTTVILGVVAMVMDTTTIGHHDGRRIIVAAIRFTLDEASESRLAFKQECS